MMQKEHERLKEQNNLTSEKIAARSQATSAEKLSLSLNHFYHSQPKKLVQEQLKYIATAIRAEKTLREHMFHMNHHRKEMKETMERSKMFSQGYQEGLTRKDQEMMQADYENQRNQDEQENKKKSTKVSDNNKFGKNRANIAKLFEKWL